MDEKKQKPGPVVVEVPGQIVKDEKTGREMVILEFNEEETVAILTGEKDV